MGCFASNFAANSCQACAICRRRALSAGFGDFVARTVVFVGRRHARAPKNSIVNFHKLDLFQKYTCDIPVIAPNKVPFSHVFPRLMG